MRTKTCPDALVIGRIVVYTQNRFLAREVEARIEQEQLLERMPSGRMRIDADTIEWVALPCSVS